MNKRNILLIVIMLAGLLFNPGVAHAQTGASGTVVAWGWPMTMDIEACRLT
jgi:hypothetical protein